MLMLLAAFLVAPALWHLTHDPVVTGHTKLRQALIKAEAAAAQLATTPGIHTKRALDDASNNAAEQLSLLNAAITIRRTPDRPSPRELDQEQALMEARVQAAQRIADLRLAAAGGNAATLRDSPLDRLLARLEPGTKLRISRFVDYQVVLVAGLLTAAMVGMRLLLRGEKRRQTFGGLALQSLCIFITFLALFAAILAAFTGIRALCAEFNWDTAGIHNFLDVNDMEELAAVLGTPVILAAYAAFVGFSISLCGADLQDRYREWWARIGSWLCIICMARAFLWLTALKGPDLVHFVLRLEWQTWSAIFAWLGTTGFGLFAANSHKSKGDSESNKLVSIVISLAPYVFILGLLLALSCLVEWLLQKPAPLNSADAVPLWLARHAPNANWSEFGTWVAACIASLALVYLLARQFDINELSMNQFYRNRLMRCYLGAARRRADRRPHPFTGFDFHDDRELSTFLAAKDTKFQGPFWIVNTALNTAKEPDLEVAERLAESFVFTPLHCGFHREGFGADSQQQTPEGTAIQGYRRLEEYHASTTSSTVPGDHVTAAFAITASGAAASPNSGYHTSPAAAFLMTLFNLRLGWWIPNPTLRGLESHKQPMHMAKYALKELFGAASSKEDYLYISDGGHFENLGVYELIRRRCKLIIVSDAEQDGSYQFHALGTAIRRCLIDFGATIKIDVSHIAPQEAGGHSRSHCAVGTIRYQDNTKGWLIYLKSSWTGDEDTDLKQYRAAHPAFPHHSTGDQWFSESQFESYRKLGRHVALSALKTTIRYFRRTHATAEGAPTPQELGKHLHSCWTPNSSAGSAAFVKNTEMLLEIWKDISRNPALSFMDPLILPALQTGAPTGPQVAPPTPEARRAGRYICQRLFQLMENVYLDLNFSSDSDHPDQSGWIELFKHWAGSSYVQEEWANSLHTYGERFQTFWKQFLDSHPGKRTAAAVPAPATPLHPPALLRSLHRRIQALRKEERLAALRRKIAPLHKPKS